MTKRKILVIYTGGTFGMSRNLKIPKLSSSDLKKRLAKNVPEMNQIAECTVDVLFNTDSCQMNGSHWKILASHILAKQNKFNGVVVLHGTDTLPYTAAALSFLLSPSKIPVVITGAQKPLEALRNDARTNFITALEVAAHAPKPLQNRVMVTFHDEVFLGSRVRKKSAVNFNAFESPRFPILAKVGNTIEYQEIIHHLPKLSKNRFQKFLTHQNTPPSKHSILKTEVTPHFPGDLFSSELLKKIDALLLTLYTSGTAPTESKPFIEFLKRAKSNNVPILVITEREKGPKNLGSYSAGQTLEKWGAIWSCNLTPEAAFVKATLITEFLLKAETQKPLRLRRLTKEWNGSLSDEL